MRVIRSFFGWLYGFVSVLCLYLGARAVWLVFYRHHGHPPPIALIPYALLLLVIVVFGLTCWNTWKKKPAARAWGLAASLMNLLTPLFSMYFFHLPLTDQKWHMIAVGFFSIVAFLWPDNEDDPASEQQDEVADSVLR